MEEIQNYINFTDEQEYLNYTSSLECQPSRQRDSTHSYGPGDNTTWTMYSTNERYDKIDPLWIDDGPRAPGWVYANDEIKHSRGAVATDGVLGERSASFSSSPGYWEQGSLQIEWDPDWQLSDKEKQNWLDRYLVLTETTVTSDGGAAPQVTPSIKKLSDVIIPAGGNSSDPSKTIQIDPGDPKGYDGSTKKLKVSLLPVDITVRKKGTSAEPDDGLIVKNGDVLQIALAPSWFDQDKQFENMIAWQYQQLKSDGTYTDWAAFATGGTGTTFEYTTNTGGVFQLKAIISVNGQQQEYKLLRTIDEVRNGEEVGFGRKGQPDAFGVVNTDIQIAIRYSAQINLGSHAYDPITAWLPSFPVNSDKCNLFVAHKATDAGATVAWINGYPWPGNSYPPTANQWAGFDPKNIPN